MVQRLQKHWGLVVIVLIYTTLAAVHSLVAPLTIGNDEWAHFLYTRFIAEHGRLPTTLSERGNKEEVGTKSDDPPLYHLLSAAVTAGVEPTPLLRPVNSKPPRQLADNAVVSFAFLVHTGYELLPYQGEVLLWHLGRALSILFGIFTIILTYVTTLTLFASIRRASLAAALLAFMPAYIFHTSVMSYDSLGAALAALLLLVTIRAIKRPEQWRWWLIMGLLTGLAITTKYTSVLLPAEIIFVAWLAFRQPKEIHSDQTRRWSGFLAPFRAALPRILVAGLVVGLAISWWFGFIVWNFNTIESRGLVVGILEPLMIRGGNDSTAIKITAFLFGGDSLSTDLPPPARPRHYPELVWLFLQSFWSATVAEKFVLSPWSTILFTLAALIGVAGLGRVGRRAKPPERIWLFLLLFHTLLITPLILVRVFVSFDPLEAVQGRHLLLPAASAIPILLVWGWEQWTPKLGQIVATGLLLWSVLGQVAWAAVVYPPPMPVWTTQHPPEVELAQLRPVNESLTEGMRLIGVDWPEKPAGQVLAITLWWQSLDTVKQDYLVELSLVDSAGQVVAYTLGQPVQGRYPTRVWEPGDLVKDVHWLPLTGSLAGDYQLRLRLLDQTGRPLAETQMIPLGSISLSVTVPPPDPCLVWFQGRPNGILAQPYRLRSTLTVISQERPTLRPQPPQADLPEQQPFTSVGNFHLFVVGPDWTGSYQLLNGGQECGYIVVDVPPRSFTVPSMANPVAATFNNEIRLLGYELPSRRITAGGRLPLTLYWQALAYMGEDYRIFDNLLDQQQQRWGGYDRRARDGYSTLLWAPGEVITDAFGVPVDPAAPNGVYTIDVGLYRPTEQGAASLPITVNGQPTGQHSLRLGPIKVGGPPPDVITTDPSPQVKLNQSFGNQITLLGYDLTRPTQNSKLNPQELNLTLYWRAEATPETDYTTFVHLRSQANENLAQRDSPPANGRYPSSLWDAGEVIVDQITLPLAGLPPGEYALVVGLYDLASGQRLPVTDDPANELRLESVTLP